MDHLCDSLLLFKGDYIVYQFKDNLLIFQSKLYAPQVSSNGRWVIFDAESKNALVAVGKDSIPKIFSYIFTQSSPSESVISRASWMFSNNLKSKSVPKTFSQLYQHFVYDTKFRDYTRSDWFRRDQETMRQFATYGTPPSFSTNRGLPYNKDSGTYTLEVDHEDSLNKIVQILFNVLHQEQLTENPNPSSHRIVPSGGGKHPVEAYVKLNQDFADYKSGDYVYDVNSNSILKTNRKLLSKNKSEIEIIFAINPERPMWRYRDSRSFRAIMIDLGHVIEMTTEMLNTVGLSYSMSKFMIDDFTTIDSNFIREPFLYRINVGITNNVNISDKREEKKQYTGQSVVLSPFVYFSTLNNMLFIHNFHDNDYNEPLDAKKFELLNYLLPSRRKDRPSSIDDLLEKFSDYEYLEKTLIEFYDDGIIVDDTVGYELYYEVHKWSVKNWYLNLLFLLNEQHISAKDNELYPVPLEMKYFNQILKRRTARNFLNLKVSDEFQSDLLSLVKKYTKSYSFLRVFLKIGQEVFIIKNDQIIVDQQSIINLKDVRKIVTNQPYAGNAYVHIFLISNIQTNAFENLTALGIIGQALINLATSYKYGSFETPAISDFEAAKFLHTGETSAVYYLEIGTGKP